jgi:hypothetical protein
MTLHAAAIPYFHQCDWGSNVQLVRDEVSDSFLQLQRIKWRLLAECRLCKADISAHLGSGEDLLAERQGGVAIQLRMQGSEFGMIIICWTLCNL